MGTTSSGLDATVEEVTQAGERRYLLRWTEVDRAGNEKACIATYSDPEAADIVLTFLRAGLLVGVHGGPLADRRTPVRRRRVRSTPHRRSSGAVHPWQR